MKKHKSSRATLIMVLVLGLFLSFPQSSLASGADDLANLIAAIGANETTVTVSDQQSVTDDLTIPSNVTLRFIQGGTLNITAAKTVTFTR